MLSHYAITRRHGQGTVSRKMGVFGESRSHREPSWDVGLGTQQLRDRSRFTHFLRRIPDGKTYYQLKVNRVAKLIRIRKLYSVLGRSGVEGFTRVETIALSETTPSRLAYLDRIGVVVPEKYSNSKKPTVIYSLEQIFEVRIFDQLKKKVALEAIKAILAAFRNKDIDTTLKNKYIVIVNDEVFWVMPDWSDIDFVMKIAEKNNRRDGQFLVVILPPPANMVYKVLSAAKTSDMIDFESFCRRAKIIDE